MVLFNTLDFGGRGMQYNKLVRDRIPEMIKNEGYTPHTRILSDSEYLEELDKKLGEETEEFHRDKNLEELADIVEVVFALCDAIGSTPDELMRLKKEKADKRGGFAKKIFLISKSKD